jgi:hypothetical protein
MSLTKQTVIDQITVTENGVIFYREATRIMEDGVQLSQTYIYANGVDQTA